MEQWIFRTSAFNNGVQCPPTDLTPKDVCRVFNALSTLRSDFPHLLHPMGQSASTEDNPSCPPSNGASPVKQTPTQRRRKLPTPSKGLFYPSPCGHSDGEDPCCPKSSPPPSSGDLFSSHLRRRRRRQNQIKESSTSTEVEGLSPELRHSVESLPRQRFKWRYWRTEAWRPRNSPEQILQLHTPICCLGVCCCCRGEWGGGGCAVVVEVNGGGGEGDVLLL